VFRYALKAQLIYQGYIDDLPPMMFIKNSANSHGWVNPRDIEAIWKVSFSELLHQLQKLNA